MSENSKIEWTDNTANFWWGCFRVSAGCQHCYADTLAHRYGKKIWGPAKKTDREYKKGIWKDVPKWNKRAVANGKRERVFCMSMGDFFEDHPQVVEWRNRAFELIKESTALDWQILTKRPENIRRMVPETWFYDWPKHVWLGTSVENQEQAYNRIPHLTSIKWATRFLSMEPLLGAVDLSGLIDGIDWVIVGGESGHNARPMHPDWVRSLRDQCVDAGVKFFFKQWGEWVPYGNHGEVNLDEYRTKRKAGFDASGRVTLESEVVMYRTGKHKAGRMLDGREWNEMPLIEAGQLELYGGDER